jgi:ubiquinone/menaquinone biosynthesis C-methylase UbiE
MVMSSTPRERSSASNPRVLRADEVDGEASLRSGPAHTGSSAPASLRFVTDPIRASVVPDFAELPDYAASLLAYHRSHGETLAGMVDALPIEPGQRWLDLATGDGTYAMLLAEKQANVIAIDSDERYLAFARRRVQRRGLRIELRAGDAYRLPFADGELDGAFCAQSFYDLEDAPRVLNEMRRVVRPGGHLAVMENDSLHHLVLPWPPDLELKLRTAQLMALSSEAGDESRFYVGRRLVPLFESQGLVDVREESFTTIRRAPLSRDERCFLEHQLTALFQMVEGRLPAEERARAHAYCTPGEPQFLLDQPSFAATILDFLVWGRVP